MGMFRRMTMVWHSTIRPRFAWIASLLIMLLAWLAIAPESVRWVAGLFVGMLYVALCSLWADVNSDQHLYRALFEQSNDAVLWIGYRGEVLRVNQRACEMLGYSMEEFPRLTMADLVPESELANAQGNLRKLRKGEHIAIFERTLRKKNGDVLPVEVNVQMVFDSAGKPVHIQSVMRDISERKREEEQRLELTVEKEKVNVLRDFINSMTHDLKTPLSVIVTSLHLLERYEDASKRHKQIQVIYRQIDLLAHMVEDMLAIARLDIVPQLELENLELTTVLQEIVEHLHLKAEHKGLRFSVRIDTSPITVQAAPDELRRAMTNLVDNAIKYTAQGGTIDITLWVNKPFVVFEVKDSGIGIKKTERIIELHGGRIAAESEINQGSTFRVWLPYHPAAQATFAPVGEDAGV